MGDVTSKPAQCVVMYVTSFWRRLTRNWGRTSISLENEAGVGLQKP